MRVPLCKKKPPFILDMSFESVIDTLEIRNANKISFVGTSSSFIDTTTGRIQTKGIQHNSNVITDVSGPHGRGVATLKKYPEIAFDDSKVDGNDITNTYTQAGYTVISSNQLSSTATANFRPWNAFNGLDKLEARNDFWLAADHYTGAGTTGIDGDADQNATLFNSRRGEWIQLETPNKVKIDKFIIKSRSYDGI